MTASSHMARFHCTACGNCCRTVRVPLTDADLRRLVAGTGRSPHELLELATSETIDLVGEPSSVVSLREGARVLLLKHDADGCIFLQQDGLCSVHPLRPTSCRTYPLEPTFGRRGGLKRLRLLQSGVECPYTLTEKPNAVALLELHRRRDRELRSYHERVRQWNVHQKRRLQLRYRLHDAAAFVAYLMDPSRTDDAQPVG